jgi:hypothetical protein
MNNIPGLKVFVKFHRGTWTARLQGVQLTLIGTGYTAWGAIGILFQNVELSVQEGELTINEDFIEIHVNGKNGNSMPSMISTPSEDGGRTCPHEDNDRPCPREDMAWQNIARRLEWT